MPKKGKYKGEGTPASRVGAWMQRLNESEGPEINFTGMCDTYPNTEAYHVALAYILSQHGASSQTAASGRIFKGYYQDGVYPSDENLLKLCAEVVPSLDASAFIATLKDDSNTTAVVARARELSATFRASGVPFFIINGQPAFSGAQEPEAFIRAFQEC